MIFHSFFPLKMVVFPGKKCGCPSKHCKHDGFPNKNGDRPSFFASVYQGILIGSRSHQSVKISPEAWTPRRWRKGSTIWQTWRSLQPFLSSGGCSIYVLYIDILYIIYIYTYIYTYIYILQYIHILKHIYIYTCIYKYIYLYIYINIYIAIHNIYIYIKTYSQKKQINE